MQIKEYVGPVDERECLVRELENAEEDIRKIRSRVKTEQSSRKLIPRGLKAIYSQRAFSRPPIYEHLLRLQRATTTTILKHFETLLLLCHPDKGGRKDFFKIILQAKNNMDKEKDPSIYDKDGIKTGD